MNTNVRATRRIGFLHAVHLAAALVAGWSFVAPAHAQRHAGPPVLAEKTVSSLPAGPLYWHIDRFRTVASAHAAATGRNALVVHAAGRIWLFTLGPADAEPTGGTRVAEIGPLPQVTAPQYLLQIREADNAPGQSSAERAYAGAGAFYVISGEQTLIAAGQTQRAKAGKALVGPAPGSAMRIVNEGTRNLHTLVMFVLDASKAASSPASASR